MIGSYFRRSQARQKLQCVIALGANAVASPCVLHAQTSPDEFAAHELKALVHSAIESDTYEDLKTYLSVTQDDGKQEVSKFDVLIFDGKSEEASPDTHLSTEIGEALHAGKWVLALDLRSAEKKTYLGPLTGFATANRSRSYLVHEVKELDGRTAWRIIDSAYRDTATPEMPGLNPERRVAFEDAAYLLQQLEDPAAGEAPESGSARRVNAVPSRDSIDAEPPDNPIPAGLIHARWYYTMDAGTGFALPQPQKRQDAATQHYRIVVNYTVTAFLNNAANATGDFEFVLTQIDGSFNSSDGTGYFANMTKEERAWFNDRIEVRYSPQAQQDFTWVGNAPQNANPSTEYTANSPFTIGFAGCSCCDLHVGNHWLLCNPFVESVFQWIGEQYEVVFPVR